LNSEKLKYQIALSLIKGLGPVLIRNIIAYLGDVEAVFKEKERVLAKIPGIGTKMAGVIVRSNPMKRAEQELEFMFKYQVNASFFLDKNFPSRLNQCIDAPVILYHKGKSALENQKMLAIVGTRQISERGKETTRNIIKDLATKFPQLTIVSGLAYGTDIHAHRAALQFGLPTVAVLAHGLDRIYPHLHKHTALELMNSGALVTEFMSTTNPDKQNFVKRNRIVAGLCDAALLIESASKGGALITAQLAHSYSRDVLAIPGRIDDSLAKGCNHLIKTNVAAMVENADDIGYALNWDVHQQESAQQLNMFLPPEGEKGDIYNMVRQQKEISLDELCMKLGVPVNRMAPHLLQLEFDGLIKSLPGNRVRCL
jgi:DNA processing protein